MYHIKQNNIGCRAEVSEYGCFYRSCGLIAEIKSGKNLKLYQINDGWTICKDKGFIDEKDNVKDSAGIINYFWNEVFEMPGKFIEIGTFKNGTVNYYGWVAKNRDCQSIDALIQKIRCNGYYGTHFRVVNKRGELLEDPHEPEINVQEVCYSILYHFVK